MTPSSPKVTVLMPVYNGEQHLRGAIESILSQTFRDYEFLIINDGSTDAGESIIRSYGDPRIRLVNNENNLKIIATLNKGFGLACGEYIARMDCDDISLPDRLHKQVSFLDAHSAVAVVGTWCRTLGDDQEKVLHYPTQPEKLRCMLLFASPLAHPTVMLRRRLFLKHNFLYDPNFLHAEDYELWARVAASFELGVLDEVLLRYRVHQGQITRAHDATVASTAGRIQLSILWELGLEPTERQFLIHRMLSTAALEPGVLLAEIDEWLCTILRANADTAHFQARELAATLVDKFFTLAKKSGKIGEWRASVFKMMFLKEGEGAFGSLARFLMANLFERAGISFSRR